MESVWGELISVRRVVRPHKEWNDSRGEILGDGVMFGASGGCV